MISKNCWENKMIIICIDCYDLLWKVVSTDNNSVFD